MGTSTLLTRITNDVNQVQNGVNLVLRLFMRSPFIVFGACVMAFTIDPGSALLFLIVVALLSVVVFGIMLLTIKRYKAIQNQLDSVLNTTRENLNGARVIRAFCGEDTETEKIYRPKFAALQAPEIHGPYLRTFEPGYVYPD